MDDLINIVLAETREPALPTHPTPPPFHLLAEGSAGTLSLSHRSDDVGPIVTTTTPAADLERYEPTAENISLVDGLRRQLNVALEVDESLLPLPSELVDKPLEMLPSELSSKIDYIFTPESKLESDSRTTVEEVVLSEVQRKPQRFGRTTRKEYTHGRGGNLPFQPDGPVGPDYQACRPPTGGHDSAEAVQASLSALGLLRGKPADRSLLLACPPGMSAGLDTINVPQCDFGVTFKVPSVTCQPAVVDANAQMPPCAGDTARDVRYCDDEQVPSPCDNTGPGEMRIDPKGWLGIINSGEEDFIGSGSASTNSEHESAVNERVVTKSTGVEATNVVGGLTCVPATVTPNELVQDAGTAAPHAGAVGAVERPADEVMDADELIEGLLSATRDRTSFAEYEQHRRKEREKVNSLGKDSGNAHVASIPKGYHWAVTEADESDDISNATSKIDDGAPDWEWFVRCLGPGRKPACTWPFTLDHFQRRAVLNLERGEHVFVAAHTSAGKTVVAEYAIALASRNQTRVIYTSPIKALSNQKYRDFRMKYGDEVGLITGDVSINPEAASLVMTTEILRSMLYRGAEIVRDIEWVVFDEVHYINNAERGVVWEETIIMLPPHVGLIFLSATTPNTIEFSEWVGRTKQRRVHVISTSKRPVPLEHFLYCGGTMHKILDSSERFLTSGHASAARTVRGGPKSGGSGRGRGRGGGRGGRRGGGGSGHLGNRSYWLSMLRDLKGKSLLPVVIFCFSKAKCEERARELVQSGGSSLGLLQCSSERAESHRVVSAALARLQGSDKCLPQVIRTKRMVELGIAVHHGGLLPILKEMVEILFSRGLVQVLFATETFAMGVNMPTRTVVFSQLRKFSGRGFRDVHAGEYTQMAGRAGRRGLDKVGTVLIAVPEERNFPELQSLVAICSGKAMKLTSQFRLKYNMILSLLRMAEAGQAMSVTAMVKRSFSEFHGASQLMIGNVLGSSCQHRPGELPKILARGEHALKALIARDRAKEASEPCLYGGKIEVEQYYHIVEGAGELENAMLSELVSARHGRKSANAAVCEGRVGLITARGLVNAPCVVVGTSRILKGTPNESTSIVVVSLCPNTFKPPATAPRFPPVPTQGAPDEIGGNVKVGSNKDQTKYVALRRRHNDDDVFDLGALSGRRRSEKAAKSVGSKLDLAQQRREAEAAAKEVAVAFEALPVLSFGEFTSTSFYGTFAVVRIDLTPSESGTPQIAPGIHLRLCAPVLLVEKGDYDLSRGLAYAVVAKADVVALAPLLAGLQRVVANSDAALEITRAQTNEVETNDPQTTTSSGSIGLKVEGPVNNGKMWSCSACTFCNPPSTLACKMCGAAKPAALDSENAVSSGWNCASCTFLNAKSSSECEMCGASAPPMLAQPSSASVSRHIDTDLGKGSLMAALPELTGDLRVNEIDFVRAWQRLGGLRAEASRSKCDRCPRLRSSYSSVRRRALLEGKLKKVRHALSDESLALFPEFIARLAVLERLHYIDDGDKADEGAIHLDNKSYAHGAVLLKGRVACEINTCNELLLTELVFEGVFEDLTPAEIASALSALILQNRGAKDEPELTPRLDAARRQMLEIAGRLEALHAECGVMDAANAISVALADVGNAGSTGGAVETLEGLKTTGQLNFALMEVVHEWACGMPFLKVCELTTVEEGSIVRCVVRLDETCRELRNVARLMGDPQLFEKAQKASELIKRDVVFAVSLYVN